MSSMLNEKAGTSDQKQLIPLGGETCADSRRCSQSSSIGKFSSCAHKTPDFISGKIQGHVQRNGNSSISGGVPSGIGLHLNSLGTTMSHTFGGRMQASAKGSVPLQGMIPLSGIKQALSEGQESCLFSVSSGQNMPAQFSTDVAPVMVASVMEKSGMDQQDWHSSGTAQIGVTKSTTCLRSLKVGINLFEGSLPVKSVDRNFSPCGIKRSHVLDISQQSTFVKGEDFKQSSPKRGRKKSGIITDKGGCKRCNCKKSKCLKLYCECFAAGLYCIEPCTCQDCFNKPDHEDMVHGTRLQIKSRNPLAFSPKIIHDDDSPQINEEERSERTASKRHQRGCNCKKSMCLKKYCECYQAQVGCSEGCRCESCKNFYGKKEV